VEAQKLHHVKSAQAAKRNLPALQPTPKVFGHKHVMPHPFTRVPAGMQIRHEARENYAKVVGRHAPANRDALEQPPDQGEIRKTLVLHRFRQLSCYPSLRPNSKQNSKQKPAKSVRRR
jgi:hypothetical protein